jgi:hypothetical protein
MWIRIRIHKTGHNIFLKSVLVQGGDNQPGGGEDSAHWTQPADHPALHLPSLDQARGASILNSVNWFEK